MSVSQEPTILRATRNQSGLKLDTRVHKPDAISHTTGDYWCESFYSVLKECGLASGDFAAFPHVTREGEWATFRLVDERRKAAGKKHELAGKSIPLALAGPVIPKEQLDALDASLRKLRERALTADDDLKTQLEKFRLPDPRNNPEYYRVWREHPFPWAERRLVILWGLQNKSSGAIEGAMQDVDAATLIWLRGQQRTEFRALTWLRRLLWLLLALLLLLLLALIVTGLSEKWSSGKLGPEVRTVPTIIPPAPTIIPPAPPVIQPPPPGQSDFSHNESKLTVGVRPSHDGTFDFGDGTRIAAKAGEAVPHTYPATGSYAIKLTPDDPKVKPSEHMVSVAKDSQPPVIPPPIPTPPPGKSDFSHAENILTTCVRPTHPGFVDFGDGTPPAKAKAGEIVPHTYPKPGVYKVTITPDDPKVKPSEHTVSVVKDTGNTPDPEIYSATLGIPKQSLNPDGKMHVVLDAIPNPSTAIIERVEWVVDGKSWPETSRTITGDFRQGDYQISAKVYFKNRPQEPQAFSKTVAIKVDGSAEIK